MFAKNMQVHVVGDVVDEELTCCVEHEECECKE